MFSRIARKGTLFGIAIGSIGGASSAYLWWRLHGEHRNVVLASSKGERHQTRQETRFNKFASNEFDGQYLMTPVDFLESVLYQSNLQGKAENCIDVLV